MARGQHDTGLLKQQKEAHDDDDGGGGEVSLKCCLMWLAIWF